MRVTLEAFQHFFIESSLERLKILDNSHKLPWSTFIGVLGMPGKGPLSILLLLLDKHILHPHLGQTAYMGWKEYSKAKKVRVFLTKLMSADFWTN